jgi:hypothetical protein
MLPRRNALNRTTVGATGKQRLPVRSANRPGQHWQTSLASATRGLLVCCLALLLCGIFSNADRAADDPASIAATIAQPLRPVRVDEGRVRAAGIRKVSSKRLTLYTDLPVEASVDELPAMFDQAFRQWCAYFGVDPDQYAEWRLTGCLMKNKLRFEACGLLPADLPKFLYGYTRHSQFWLFNPTTEYYRRHLLLHEGTHGFMYTMLGDCGPPWYAEGMAELMATHKWEKGHLTLRYFPAHPTDVPKLGRIEIVQTDFANHRALKLGEVLAYDLHAHLKEEPYGWSWAAVAFLDGHPRYQDRFRKLWRHVNDADFNRHFTETFADDSAELAEDWQVFVADIAYGYDFQRTLLDFTPGKKLPSRGATVNVAADRCWQNTMLRLEAGKTYRLQASGKYQVAKSPRVWWCEPGGISIRYLHGRPLGVLMAAVHPDGPHSGSSALAMPIIVGTETKIRPSTSGTLYLRINNSAGELDSASGSLTVRVGPD